MGRDGAFVHVEFPLEKGERQLWSGAPTQRLFHQKSHMVGALFVAGFIAYPFYIGEIAFGEDLLASTFATLWVLVGSFMAIGPVTVDWFRRRGTLYGITNERAIIMSRKSTMSLYHVEIHVIRLQTARDGVGTIVFGEDEEPDTVHIGGVSVKFGNRRGARAPRFAWIPDVQAVHDILQSARRAARAPATQGKPAPPV